MNNLSRPGARHPGEDYRCHCDYLPLEDSKGLEPDPIREPQPVEGLIENYSGSELAKAAKGITDEWAKQFLQTSFNEIEKDAIFAWQSGYYAEIDSYLNAEGKIRTKGQIKALEERIQALDNAIDKSEIPAEFRVMSGVEDLKDLGIDYNKIEAGDVIDMNSYLATSTSEKIAKGFSKKSKTILEVNMKKGNKGLYINNVSNLKPHEKEFLLGRGQRYKIIEKYEKDGYKYIKMEVEP